MNPLRALLILLLFNAEAFGIATLKLNEIFSVEGSPGNGKLVYTQGEKVETIALGEETGHYALGIIFKGTSLPEPYSKDFKDDSILQIALGTMRSKVQFQVPQFGAVTLVSRGPLTTRTVFKLTVPTGSPSIPKSLALLLFTSPFTPNEQNDEEKLKGTYFAQSGTLTVTPKGKPKLIGVRSQGKNVNFKKQTMTVDFKAGLATPFNAQENNLKGTIEFPVYWPSGKQAEKLTQKIATDSLGGMGPVPSPDGLPYNRDVAGSTKKDK